MTRAAPKTKPRKCSRTSLANCERFVGDGQEVACRRAVRPRNAELDKPGAAAEGDGGRCYAECEAAGVVCEYGDSGSQGIAMGGGGSVVTG
jgi:hypothetical protein